ncbi:MAG: SCO family protein [Acidimicrobiales bacterium]|jgi:protein SCO1/2|nr:SCO family protein [Acidimicrobiales bacterium]
MASPDTTTATANATAGTRARVTGAVLAAVLAATSLGAAACGDDADTDTDAASASGAGQVADIQGVQRETPLAVGEVTIPEVTEGSEGTFDFVAEPGELLVNYFGYTACPDICPTSLADLRDALEAVGDDADKVSLSFVTVDPERDTAEQLNGFLPFFVENYHALRTDDPAELEAVENAFLASSTITPTEDGEYEVSHTAFFYVIDANGDVIVEWPFGTTAEAMASDLEILLADLPSQAG